MNSDRIRTNASPLATLLTALQKDFLLYARTNKAGKLLEALKVGAAVDGADEYGWTALMHATSAQMECADTVKALLELGADHTRSDSEGHTPLMFAAWRGSLSCVSHLLAAGANPAATDRMGKTALDHAKAERRDAVVKLLQPLTPDPWQGANVDRLRAFDASLCAAVVSLIHRAECVGMRGTVQVGEPPQSLEGIIPKWYSLILTSVPLAGIEFASPNPNREWTNYGWFRHFNDIAHAYKESYPEIEIVKEGYFAFASSENGEVWVLPPRSQLTDPVFLWDTSGWKPIEAYASFPSFLQSLKVTDIDR